MTFLDDQAGDDFDGVREIVADVQTPGERITEEIRDARVWRRQFGVKEILIATTLFALLASVPGFLGIETGAYFILLASIGYIFWPMCGLIAYAVAINFGFGQSLRIVMAITFVIVVAFTLIIQLTNPRALPLEATLVLALPWLCQLLITWYAARYIGNRRWNRAHRDWKKISIGTEESNQQFPGVDTHHSNRSK